MDATAWDEHYGAHDHGWGLEPNLFVREQCQGLPVGRAIDLACGEGRNAVWLARLGWRVTGVDVSAVAIERARTVTAEQSALHALRLEWQVGDITLLRPKPGSLDLVLASYVHLPTEDLYQVLTRTAAALRPGGHLVAVAHDKRNLTEGISGPQDVDLLYDPNGLRALLADGCGLTVEVARTAERSTPEGIALDTVIRARR